MDHVREVEATLEQWRRLIHVEAARADFGTVACIEHDDLVQIASLAVLEAMETYDPARATLFTWVRRKIRWAIGDYVRHIRPGRQTPVDVLPVSLEVMAALEELSPSDGVEQDVIDRAERLALQDFLRWWVDAHHPSYDHRVVVAHRLEGATLREAGLAAGLTESRACQIMGELHQLAREYGSQE